jgi:hypothetical protein
MLLWFVGGSVLAVWLVFRSPLVDYRLVAVGSVLPLIDVALGGPRVLHSVTGSAALLGLAMVVRPGRRLAQRRLVGIPIGTFLHLALDGAWTDSHGFWWPFFGFAWSDAEAPEVARGGWLVVLELAGAAMLGYAWRAFGLADRARRQRLLRTGHLDRAVAG